MDDYLGILVDPHEMQSHFPNYSRIAWDHMMDLEDKAILSENPENYLPGEFDIVTYENLPGYVDEVDPDTVFVSGKTASMQEAVETLNGREIVLDENPLTRNTVDIPSTKQVLVEEAKALIPMYQPDRQNVEITTSEDILRELGLEDLKTHPVQLLQN